MLDGPVFARRIHRLKVDQKGISILRIQFALKLCQKLDALAKTLLCLLLAEGAPLFPTRREILSQPDLSSRLHYQPTQQPGVREVTRHARTTDRFDAIGLAVDLLSAPRTARPNAPQARVVDHAISAPMEEVLSSIQRALWVSRTPGANRASGHR